MAGYFSKLNGRVYDGQYEANAAFENGTFVELNSSGKLVSCSTNEVLTLQCVEKTDLWGNYALRLRVIAEDGEVFMVEQDFNMNEYGEYDERDNGVKAGQLARVRCPHISDEILLEVTSTLYNNTDVGDKFNIGSGTIVAAE